MNSQFKKGILELCVLALLYERDFYGYELVVEISTKIDISEGTIYPLLRRLTKEGYFDTYLKESNEGPPRKYYHMTEEGKKKYEQLSSEWNDFISHVTGILAQGGPRATV